MEDKFGLNDEIFIETRRKNNMNNKNEICKLVGDWLIEARCAYTGEVLETRQGPYTILNSGRERVAKLIFDNSNDDFSYIALGTGTTGVLVTDASLETEVDREQADSGGAYEADYKAVFIKTFTFGSGESYAITEAGLGDTASEIGSTLLDRFVFSALNVSSSVDLYCKITITVA